MKKQVWFVFVCLIWYQLCFSDLGRMFAQNVPPDTLAWTWEVSSTVSTRTKNCTFEFSDNLLVNWGDGVTEWIPDSMSSKTITHVYATQANYACKAIGVGIVYFKADSRRILELDVTKVSGLTYLSCTSNQLGSLDLTNNPALVSLYCGGNRLQQLDVHLNQNLQTLTCSDNQLSQLDLSMLPLLKKVTCHTNPLSRIGIHSSGALGYLSCYGCSLTAEQLDSIFLSLPVLPSVSSSKNLFVLNNPGSSACRSELAATKNWTLDRVITQSSFYIPSLTCKAMGDFQANVCLKNTSPAMAFEMDVLIPAGFELDTLKTGLAAGRKGQHLLSMSRMSDSLSLYKFMTYSLKSKDVFCGSDGAVLELFLKAPAEMKTYTLDIQNALLLDTLTNLMDLSLTDGQLVVGTSSLVGDANGDGTVDVTDVVNLVAWINGKCPEGLDTAAVDLDGNGLWNVIDVTKLVVLINSSAVSPRSGSMDLSDLSLYQAGTPSVGNNLYLRQAFDDASCVEICLDNTDGVQAFQTDLILPDGLEIAVIEDVQASDRLSGQTFSLKQIAPNCYRLLAYALKTDAAISGKTGVLCRFALSGTENLAQGDYPIRMQQAVLTGMDLKSLSSSAFDAVLTFDPFSSTGAPVLWTDATGLWVSGKNLLDLTIWDFNGLSLLRKSLKGLFLTHISLKKGPYLVLVRNADKKTFLRKLAVK